MSRVKIIVAFWLCVSKLLDKRSPLPVVSSCYARNSGRRKWSTNVPGACFPAPDSFRTHCTHRGNVPFLAPRVFPPARRFFFRHASGRRSAAIIYPARVATVHATCITRVHDARTRPRAHLHARTIGFPLYLSLSLSWNVSRKRSSDTDYRLQISILEKITWIGETCLSTPTNGITVCVWK